MELCLLDRLLSCIFHEDYWRWSPAVMIVFCHRCAILMICVVSPYKTVNKWISLLTCWFFYPSHNEPVITLTTDQSVCPCAWMNVSLTEKCQRRQTNAETHVVSEIQTERHIARDKIDREKTIKICLICCAFRRLCHFPGLSITISHFGILF